MVHAMLWWWRWLLAAYKYEKPVHVFVSSDSRAILGYRESRTRGVGNLSTAEKKQGRRCVNIILVTEGRIFLCLVGEWLSDGRERERKSSLVRKRNEFPQTPTTPRWRWFRQGLLGREDNYISTQGGTGRWIFPNFTRINDVLLFVESKWNSV